jgi:hypothetical protein
MEYLKKTLLFHVNWGQQNPIDDVTYLQRANQNNLLTEYSKRLHNQRPAAVMPRGKLPTLPAE